VKYRSEMRYYDHNGVVILAKLAESREGKLGDVQYHQLFVTLQRFRHPVYRQIAKTHAPIQK
jgi:hypothetical protein